ncbi:hypothetical protein GCM10027040_19570 [Halomonas shantousis]
MRLATTLLLTTLAGCVSLNPPSALESRSGQPAPSQVQECCQTLADLPYRPLQADQTLTLSFDATTPVHQFADGRSYFHAFALPRNGQPLTLRLTSAIDDEQVFAPTLLLLDERFQPVRRVSSDQFRYQGPSGFRDARLSGAVSVMPGPDAAYVVVYTSEQARQGTTTYESPEKVYARVRGLAVPDIDDPVAAHTATGRLTLEVSPLGDGGLLAPLMGHAPSIPLNATDTVQTAAPSRPASASPPSVTAVVPANVAPVPDAVQPELDYRRMIRAALKADDVELALQLAEHAEQAGQQGTRAWLADQLRAR